MSDQPVQLHAHPDCVSHGVERLLFQIARDGDGVQLRFDLVADLSTLSIAQSSVGQRRDGLWQHTCFEAFFAPENEAAYCEFNFAPNGDWAAYRFSDYRQNGQDLETPAPTIEAWQTADGFSMCVSLATLPEALQSGAIRIGPSAVIEARDGTKSYWALHHPANKPDFHRIENFKLSLD
jgi:hypothetical protein